MKRKILLCFPLALIIAVLAACGSSATTSGATGTPTATAVANCPPIATGTITSISNTGLTLATRQGTQAQVILGSSTVFVEQTLGTTADLKEGTRVTATIRLNSDGTYSALSVSVRSTTANLSGLGGLAVGSRACITPRKGGAKGTPGAGFSGTPGAGFGGGTTGQTLNGTVGQLSGNSLVIIDTSGNNITIQLATTTRIAITKTITASDLKVGESITATGTKDSQGAIHATYVLIAARQAPVPAKSPTPVA